MGLEFKIETYDSIRTGIPEFVEQLPEFLRKEDGNLHLTTDGNSIALTITTNDEDASVYVTLHVACRETDAIFGLIVRRLLSLNDHVVISEC